MGQERAARSRFAANLRHLAQRLSGDKLGSRSLYFRSSLTREFLWFGEELLITTARTARDGRRRALTGFGFCKVRPGCQDWNHGTERAIQRVSKNNREIRGQEIRIHQ
jgi:hypothetical protein